MNNLELYIYLNSENRVVRDILILILDELGCNSISEDKSLVCGYFPSDVFNEDDFLNLLKEYGLDCSYEIKYPKEKKWNEEWEKNYQPVYIENKVAVLADFHKLESSFDYVVRINPKMSFGTGHHSTTFLMIKAMLSIDFDNKEVVDAGSGTGILAIMSSKLGAKSIFAYDVENGAIENSLENVKINLCNNIKIKKSDSSCLQSYRADVILANINKNILLQDSKIFYDALTLGGVLVLSGFYISNNNEIISEYSKLGFNLSENFERDNWSCLVFLKQFHK